MKSGREVEGSPVRAPLREMELRSGRKWSKTDYYSVNQPIAEPTEESDEVDQNSTQKKRVKPAALIGMYNWYIVIQKKNVNKYSLFLWFVVAIFLQWISRSQRSWWTWQKVLAEEVVVHAYGDPEYVRKRSRLANPDSWRGNQRKQKRNEGSQYLSSRGKIVAARSIKNLGQDCTCKMKCSSKISHKARERLFKSFWAMGNLQRQRGYLGTMVKSTTIRRKRVKTSTKRKFTLYYSFTYSGINHCVCKPFFLTTLDINYAMIKTALEKFDRSSSTMQSPDNRGRQTPSIKIPLHVTEFAKAHIDKLLRVPSHWINKAKIYEAYVEYCRTDGEPEMRVVSRTFYHNLLSRNRDDDEDELSLAALRTSYLKARETQLIE